MSLINQNDGHPHFCFDHAIAYGDDGLMCPKCESEICEYHDNQMERKMNNTGISDTSEIQEASLVNFMAAIGYEPTYKPTVGGERLTGFFQPKFFRIGQARLSVNTAIRLHNEYAEESFAELISFTPNQEFRDFVSDYDNIDKITSLFAGTCKIVNFVSATYSKKKGFVVHNHNVKFMTKRDQRRYGF